MQYVSDRAINLYLDLDGVVADFDNYFRDYFQKDHKQMDDSEMWALIDSHPTFFKSLPMISGAKEFFNFLSFMYPDLVILTACPKTHYKRAATQKRQWVYENLGDFSVLPVLGGRNKALFMHKPGDILIDDFAKNITAWIEMGGYGIYHESYDSTVSQLVSYISSR